MCPYTCLKFNSELYEQIKETPGFLAEAVLQALENITTKDPAKTFGQICGWYLGH